MNDLTIEQQVRFECIIAAFESINVQIENDEPVIDNPYTVAEEMYKYIMDRKIPMDSILN